VDRLQWWTQHWTYGFHKFRTFLERLNSCKLPRRPCMIELLNYRSWSDTNNWEFRSYDVTRFRTGTWTTLTLKDRNLYVWAASSGFFSCFSYVGVHKQLTSLVLSLDFPNVFFCKWVVKASPLHLLLVLCSSLVSWSANSLMFDFRKTFK
jgi:hypothetical protein